MLLLYENKTETKAKITLVHYKPDDPQNGLPEEVKQQGIMVDILPEALPYQRGKSAEMYCNPQTNEVWYEYVDRPLSPEEKMEAQEEKIDLLLQMQMSTQGII